MRCQRGRCQHVLWFSSQKRGMGLYNCKQDGTYLPKRTVLRLDMSAIGALACPCPFEKDITENRSVDQSIIEGKKLVVRIRYENQDLVSGVSVNFLQ